MINKELDIHGESFEPTLPPRLTLGRDVADVVKAYKQPFIEAWGAEDETVQLIEDLGCITFDGFGEPDENGDYFSDTILLGADRTALSDLVVEDDGSFIVNMFLFRGDDHLDLDPGKEGYDYEHDREHVVFISPDMPPTAVSADFIEGPGNHISDLSYAVAKYGSDIMHPLSDEDCAELIRLLRTVKISDIHFRGYLEDRVVNHWEEY